MLPTTLPLANDFDSEQLYKIALTGGQIEMVIKNTAYKLAIEDEPIFKTSDFLEEIRKEEKSMFDKELSENALVF